MIYDDLAFLLGDGVFGVLGPKSSDGADFLLFRFFFFFGSIMGSGWEYASASEALHTCVRAVSTLRFCFGYLPGDILKNGYPRVLFVSLWKKRCEKSHWPMPDSFQHRQDTKKGRDRGKSRTKCPSPAFAPHVFPHFHLHSTC